MNLSPEENKRRIMALKAMFMTEGWKYFLEDYQLQKDALPGIVLSGQVTIEDVYRLTGRNEVYSYILGYKDMVENIEKMNETDE